MKRITALILCALVVLSCAAAVSAAELTTFTIIPEKTEAAPGDTIDFTITVEATEGCRTLGLILEYDTAIFEAVEGKCNDKDALISTFDPSRGFVFLYAKAVKLDGEICTFTLKVRDAAAAGTYEIGLKASMKDTNDPIESEITPASVTVVRAGNQAPAPKPTEAPKETQPPKETNPPKETEVPKETETPETTEAPTEAKPTETKPEIPEETPAPETQAPTQEPEPTEPALTMPKKEFEFPLWAIAVYALGLVAIIVILILKHNQKKRR